MKKYEKEGNSNFTHQLVAVVTNKAYREGAEQQIVTAQTSVEREEMWTEKWTDGTSGAPQQASTISWFSSTMACTEMKISPSYSAWSYY